jgi:hypothetical protein
MNGDQLRFEDTPTKPKTDGTGAHVGVYNGTVTVDPFQPNHGFVDGKDYDKQVPTSGSRFHGSGPATCLAFAPGPPAAAPTPGSFNQPVAVQANPGADTSVSSPRLGDASQASATADGATPNDEIVFAPLPQLQHACFVDLVKGLSMLGRDEIDAGTALGFTTLAECLIAVDEQDEFGRGIATAKQATASACGQFQTAVTSHGRRKTVRVTHVGAIPNEPIRATCKFSAGQATVTLVSNRRGTPLRNLIGPRLQIGFLRSRSDRRGGQVKVRFARH